MPLLTGGDALGGLGDGIAEELLGSLDAALQIAESEATHGREAVIVTILCDGAEKYMSERFWTEE